MALIRWAINDRFNSTVFFNAIFFCVHFTGIETFFEYFEFQLASVRIFNFVLKEIVTLFIRSYIHC